MISLLSSAKSFVGHSRQPQIRALKSWLALSPDVEVILYGYSEGADEVSKTLGIMYVPKIESAVSGSPYFNAIAAHASAYARHDIQAYVNCDILLTRSVLRAVTTIKHDKYLMIGQRVDLHKGVDLDVESPDWVNRLKYLQEHNMVSLHPPSGKDYFIFPRGLWDGMASLIIGRNGFDCGLLAYCLQKNIPIIDATRDIVSIHQFHDYRHLLGGEVELVNGPDARHNYQQFYTEHAGPGVDDAGWTLCRGKLEQTCARGDYLRRAELYLRFTRRWKLASLALRAIWRILTALRIYHTLDLSLQQVIDGYAESAETGL